MIQAEKTNNEQAGSVIWRSPSNIAIVKYWGKYGEQLPKNPSISLTLSEAATTTKVDFKPGNGAIEFYFEGKHNDAFATRVAGFVQRIAKEFPRLNGLDLTIHSENSFPHSAGIASSASAMSALALCLGSIGDNNDDGRFLERASYNSRLGSGSAARSVSGPVMLWGETSALDGSSNEKAVEVKDVHPIFATYCDSILIVSKEEKLVGSTAGHALMNGHPYAEQRFARAAKHTGDLLAILRDGDPHAFGRLAEQEALDLHAMMMASTPPYLLIRPNTVAIIEELKRFRESTGVPAYMTLDAGPNVHLLYPLEVRDVVLSWIEAVLEPLCQDGVAIHDHVGMGAVKL